MNKRGGRRKTAEIKAETQSQTRDFLNSASGGAVQVDEALTQAAQEAMQLDDIQFAIVPELPMSKLDSNNTDFRVTA